MNSHIFSDSYKVTSYLVNLRGRAGLYSILNFIQDVGWMHATALNVKLAKNQGWVFTRQKLLMQDWPAWNQTVTIRTWLRPPEGAFVFRDYEIFVGEEKLGECTSTFTVMDMETRKLAQVDWGFYQNIWRSDGHHPHKPAKIMWSEDSIELTKFEVRNSDIDLNRHVNNTKYAQWILDAIPIDLLRDGAQLLGYEVNFMAESKIGDVIALQKKKADLQEGETSIIQFQGARVADQKPIFTATLQVRSPT